MALPSFGVLATLYPDYWRYPSPKSVQTLTGGETADPDITNTCAIRMSHAMNGAGVVVPPTWGRVTNRRGANRRYYIIRVTDLRTFLESRLGPPTIDLRPRGGRSVDRGEVAGYKGVIAFDIGFTDATGHFDLWYGDRFSHEQSAGKDYFALASRVSLWHDGTRTVAAPV